VVNTLLRGRSRDTIRRCLLVKLGVLVSAVRLFMSSKAGGEDSGEDDIFTDELIAKTMDFHVNI
jgi:hypothetical protein